MQSSDELKAHLQDHARGPLKRLTAAEVQTLDARLQAMNVLGLSAAASYASIVDEIMTRRSFVETQVHARVAPKAGDNVEKEHTETPASPASTPKPATLISTPGQGPFSTLDASGDDAELMQSVPNTPSLHDMVHRGLPHRDSTPKPASIAAAQPSSQDSTISIDAIHSQLTDISPEASPSYPRLTAKHNREETPQFIAESSGGIASQSSVGGSPKRVEPSNTAAFPASIPPPQTPRGQQHRDKPDRKSVV